MLIISLLLTALFALPRWLAFFDKGAHALFLVLTGEENIEEFFFIRHAISQAHFKRFVDRFFTHLHTQRGAGRNLAGEGQRFVQIILQWGNAAG